MGRDERERSLSIHSLQYVASIKIHSLNTTMPSVTYSSTRGGQSQLDFRSVVMQGLARDKGLFVPDAFPKVSAAELQAWRSLSYPDLAVQVIRKYVQDDQVPLDKLKDIVGRSCAAFRHEDVTPVVQVGGHAVLVSLDSNES